MENIRVEKYFEEGEESVWQGRAKENDFAVTRFINLLPLVCVWLVLELIVLGYTAITKAMLGKEFNTYYLLLVIGAILLHLVPTVLWAVGIVKENERVSREEYAVTKKRVIVSGSQEFESVTVLQAQKILDIKMKRSLGELITGTGRIVFETEEGKLVLYSVANAEKVLKTIYRALMVKGDE